LITALAAATAAPAEAITGNPLEYKKELARRRKAQRIPESEYTDGPEGLKYYDVEVGSCCAMWHVWRASVPSDRP